MENVEKFTRNDFPVLGNPGLVDVALKGSHELISILLDHESHELLLKRQSAAVSQGYGRVHNGTRTYLSDIQIGLHDKERIQGIGTRCVRVVKEIFDLGERCLSEARTSVLRGNVRLRMSLFEAERLWGMRQRGDDPRVSTLR